MKQAIKFAYGTTLSLTLMLAVYSSTHDIFTNGNKIILVFILISLAVGYLSMLYLPDVKENRRKSKLTQTDLSDIVKDLFG